MPSTARVAFFDFDGTLVSSNIVNRYAFLVRRLPSRPQAAWRLLKLISSVPAFIALDHASRRAFNQVFFKEYRGMRKEWLEQQAPALFERVIRRTILPGAKEMIDRDREQGMRLVLVTGELDSALGPVISYFGFDGMISNRLVFNNGVATGDVVAPLIAEESKVPAMAELCRRRHAKLADSKAYSDSFSDVPMLEAVASPCAVNPDRRLRKIAEARGWPVRDLAKTVRR